MQEFLRLHNHCLSDQLRTMAENPSDTSCSTQGTSTQHASDTDLPPGSDSEARRIALSQALLQALTERGEHTEDSQSSVSSLSNSEFRDQLADFIEISNKDINDLKERVSRLEALISQ